MTKYCTDCGTENDDDARYCSGCGTQLTEPTETPTETQTDDETTATTPQPDTHSRDVPPTRTSENSLLDRLGRARQSLILSCVGVVVGAFLPWFSVTVLGTTVTVAGIDRDGVFTLIVAVLVLGFALAHWTNRTRQASIVLGALVAGLSALYISDPYAFSGSETTQLQRNAINIGFGLYLTFLSGIGVAAAAYAADTEAT